MNETKIYADGFRTTFASTTEMLEFLAERAKQSKWIRKPTRMLKLVPLGWKRRQKPLKKPVKKNWKEL